MHLKLNSICLALALAIASVSGAPSPSASFTVHESITSPPKGFTKASSAALTSQSITLRIQLTANNIAGLEEELYAVSIPGSAKYGQHLSAAEVASYVSPANETTSLVGAWLDANGLEGKTASNAGDWVEITLPVSQANELLDAEFSTYTDASGNQFIRTLSYSILSELQGHINLIHPTVNFPINASLPLNQHVVHTPTRRTTAPASCQTDGNTPTCIQDIYSIPTTPATNPSNSLWVSGFVGEWVDHSDVASFIAEFRPDIPSTVNTTFNVITINGGENSEDPADSGTEAILDIEFTVGMATGVPVTFLSVGPVDPGTDFQDFLNAVLVEADFLVGLDTAPLVLTSSYAVDETFVSPALATSICNAYMQLGARGTSVLFASGDGGVGGTGEQTCNAGDAFIPTFPASCPFLTAVGATMVTTGNTEEVTFFSAGGFSNIFPQPSYQASAVSAYLDFLGSNFFSLYNSTGRGFPDVSANGWLYRLFMDDFDEHFATGTSASSPTFASVVALINDQLLNAGKSPLGFLNPFLYANPDALTDITTGSNGPACGTNGFSATTGWDPASGLGTPTFPSFVAAVGV